MTRPKSYEAAESRRSSWRPPHREVWARVEKEIIGSITDYDPKAKYKNIPDVRDGLTREERVVLYVLHETQKERGDRNVPTAMLWGGSRALDAVDECRREAGRVVLMILMMGISSFSAQDLSLMLARLGARTDDTRSV